jgi:hypothetical protein
MDHSGPIAIHVGHCKTKGSDFSYFPSFLLPGRQWSRASWCLFIKSYQLNSNVKASLDEVIGHFEKEDVTMPLSSAYNLLYAALRPMRMNCAAIGCSMSELVANSISVYRSISKSSRDLLFSTLTLRWHAFHRIILIPP